MSGCSQLNQTEALVACTMESASLSRFSFKPATTYPVGLSTKGQEPNTAQLWGISEIWVSMNSSITFHCLVKNWRAGLLVRKVWPAKLLEDQCGCHLASQEPALGPVSATSAEPQHCPAKQEGSLGAHSYMQKACTASHKSPKASLESSSPGRSSMERVLERQGRSSLWALAASHTAQQKKSADKGSNKGTFPFCSSLRLLN